MLVMRIENCTWEKLRDSADNRDTTLRVDEYVTFRYAASYPPPFLSSPPSHFALDLRLTPHKLHLHQVPAIPIIYKHTHTQGQPFPPFPPFLYFHSPPTYDKVVEGGPLYFSASIRRHVITNEPDLACAVGLTTKAQ